MSRPAPGEWEVESLRATAFTTDLIPPSYGDELWKKVVGTEAESISRKSSMGTFAASGPVDDAMLALTVTPGRIDWLFGPASVEALLEQSLGKFQSQDERFIERLSNWLQFPTLLVSRIALGIVVRLPVQNRIAGYRLLGVFLPKIAPDPENARDFMYQINRPRDSQVVPGLMINRLSKWASVDTYLYVMGATKATSLAQFVRLELDVSTDKDAQRDLSKDKGLSPLYRELASLCREIVANGDIP
jgi:hypothetical protein